MVNDEVEMKRKNKVGCLLVPSLLIYYLPNVLLKIRQIITNNRINKTTKAFIRV